MEPENERKIAALYIELHKADNKMQEAKRMQESAKIVIDALLAEIHRLEDQ